ncbi:class 1b ribonucleoside-diphosphate reductase subunit alpha [Ureaplasma miroungigenitalium]|uniref:class 1b ribonucleoside-diphosphate reductase subunit alpha n=1 Tax=Ureaplasma miroungigenitalium TaxID=1042321 RepID=UPI0021E72994|nr:class 1b ribonucleoside-diphosphate reductase subunit alpha [Ureaplasma miroungigenitalium]MCV3734327.1 class 1b ribonucleoside-diphosphate reductase subunit alpha [Ureaplasma miroungigenitalium]
MNKDNKNNRLINDDEYIAHNALIGIKSSQFKIDFQQDKIAVQKYIETQIKPFTKTFDSKKQRLMWLIENDYYDVDVIDKYDLDTIVELEEFADSFKHTFPNFMGALKFYSTYCLKTFDHQIFLENFAQRIVMNALVLANGDVALARALIQDIITYKFQPATPTFLNAGKKQRGEYVSCYLLRVEDNMESIARAIATSLQLSKRAGGVALCLTNLREAGAPIKQLANKSSGVIPVMKILEDSFSYANQLGQRPGAGVVYLNVHHPDVLAFLDTKRENADEKVRIKSLSLGLIVPDITFELAKANKQMALFSPYDVQREYNKPLSDISITEEYENLVNNKNIKKYYIEARKLFQTISELHFESGYPYLLFDDTVNNRSAYPNERIVMSNLCSEIAQPSKMTTFNEDLSIDELGTDISCNLGSLNIAKMMQSGADFGNVVKRAIQALNTVSRVCKLDCAPTIQYNNDMNHALGLGAMNMHGFLATNSIYYDSQEALDFTNIFFYTVAYYAFKASNELVDEFGVCASFATSKYADGSQFNKYTQVPEDTYIPKTQKIKEIFVNNNIYIPTQKEWKLLVQNIKTKGLANSHLLAIAPTGSISYLSSCTPSLQPVVAPVEVRKEGQVGRVYVPAYEINNENYKFYAQGAYELGPNPIIDLAAVAQEHIDQAISLTLFMTDKATTRDLNKAYIRAFSKKCASIYYVRIRQDVLEGSENYDDYQCESCKI